MNLMVHRSIGKYSEIANGVRRIHVLQMPQAFVRKTKRMKARPPGRPDSRTACLGMILSPTGGSRVVCWMKRQARANTWLLCRPHLRQVAALPMELATLAGIERVA